MWANPLPTENRRWVEYTSYSWQMFHHFPMPATSYYIDYFLPTLNLLCICNSFPPNVTFGVDMPWLRQPRTIGGAGLLGGWWQSWSNTFRGGASSGTTTAGRHAPRSEWVDGCTGAPFFVTALCEAQDFHFQPNRWRKSIPTRDSLATKHGNAKSCGSFGFRCLIPING